MICVELGGRRSDSLDQIGDGPRRPLQQDAEQDRQHEQERRRASEAEQLAGVLALPAPGEERTTCDVDQDLKAAEVHRGRWRRPIRVHRREREDERERGPRGPDGGVEIRKRHLSSSDRSASAPRIVAETRAS